MWKIFAGFIVFALIALFVIMKAGDKVDMQGEAGHGVPSSSSDHSSSPPSSTPSSPTAPSGGAPASSK